MTGRMNLPISCVGGQVAALEDPLAELHMEDYDTDEGGEKMDTETASRLFGSGNPGAVLRMGLLVW